MSNYKHISRNISNKDMYKDEIGGLKVLIYTAQFMSW